MTVRLLAPYTRDLRDTLNHASDDLKLPYSARPGGDREEEGSDSVRVKEFDNCWRVGETVLVYRGLFGFLPAVQVPFNLALSIVGVEGL